MINCTHHVKDMIALKDPGKTGGEELYCGYKAGVFGLKSFRDPLNLPNATRLSTTIPVSVPANVEVVENVGSHSQG